MWHLGPLNVIQSSKYRLFGFPNRVNVVYYIHAIARARSIKLYTLLDHLLNVSKVSSTTASNLSHEVQL